MSHKKTTENKNSGNSFIFGVITGLLAFGAFDYLRDSKKRKELVTDAKQLEKDLKPYIREFTNALVESEELKKSVKTVDAILGTDLEGYVKNLQVENTQNNKGTQNKKISSVRKFFKFKK